MSQLLNTEGGVIAYDLTGPTDGPLCILVPGIGDLRASYRFLAPALAAAGWRVAAMDLRGHGASSAGWPEYTPQAVGRDMLALAHHLGSPALLGGCSMSAASAVWAAVEEPAAVRGLLLLGPALVDGPLTFSQRAALGLALRGPWRVRAWDAFFASLFPTRKPADLADYRAALRANLAEPGRFDAVRAFLYASKAACSARMADMHAPTLLLMGEKDPDYPNPAETAQRWAAVLHAEAQVIAGAGHYPHVDSADVVAPQVVAWAAALPGGPMVQRDLAHAGAHPA